MQMTNVFKQSKKPRHQSSTSRRGFIRNCSVVASLVPIVQVFSQSRQTLHNENSVQIHFIKRFNNGHLLDVLPDGSLLCMYFGSAVWTFSSSRSARTQGSNSEHYRLAVINARTWEIRFSTELSERPISATFVPDGIGLYVETFGRRRLMVDLATKRVNELSPVVTRPEQYIYYENALSNGRILGGELRRKEGYHALLLATLGDFKELQRVDTTPKEDFGSGGRGVSADRLTLVYAVDHSIVCRRTEDLSVVWERPVEPQLRVSKVAISSGGHYVAVAAVNTQFVEGQREYYVALLSGRDGSVISKLPLNGDVGIEISPDGKLLAVSQRKPNDKPQKIQPTVRIYDFASGQVVAAATHDAVSTREGYIWGILQSRFTPDGKYLLTYGDDDTRVWEIS